MDKETAKMAVSRCVMDRMEREKESNATMGCLAGLFYVCGGQGRSRTVVIVEPEI